MVVYSWTGRLTRGTERDFRATPLQMLRCWYRNRTKQSFLKRTLKKKKLNLITLKLAISVYQKINLNQVFKKAEAGRRREEMLICICKHNTRSEDGVNKEKKTKEESPPALWWRTWQDQARTPLLWSSYEKHRLFKARMVQCFPLMWKSW